MKYIALFGPPACGKSTLIKEFKKIGVRAYDLEKYGHTYQERKNALQKILKKEKSDHIIFGAADMRINDFPKDTTKILLLPPLEIYQKRLKERNKKYPHKEGQDAINKYFSIDKSKYDIIYSKDIPKKVLLKEILTKTR
ncbi:MAG: hypothetical protein ACFFG0_28675 [Candidatus Thorarchaeota archaeon]